MSACYQCAFIVRACVCVCVCVCVTAQARFVYNDWLEKNKGNPNATVTLFEVTSEAAKATRKTVSVFIPQDTQKHGPYASTLP